MPNIGDIIRAKDLQDLLEQINNSSSNIVGELKYFGFNEVPEHCLMCDGSEISRETYSELFAKYGTIYGEGDGSTTFNIPDYRGAFLRCIGGNAAELGVEQGDAIRDIKGNVTVFGSWGSVTGVVCCISPEIGDPQNNCFYNDNTGTNSIANLQSTGQPVTNYGLFFRAGKVVPTADENRPINYAVNVCVVFE